MKETPVPANTGSGVSNDRPSGCIFYSFFLYQSQFLKYFPQPHRHGFGQRMCQLFWRTFPIPEHPLHRHINRTKAIHFQFKLQFGGNLSSCPAFDLLCVKLLNQFKIMISQAILLIIFECRPKKQLLHLNVFKFVDKALVDGSSFSHVLK